MDNDATKNIQHSSIPLAVSTEWGQLLSIRLMALRRSYKITQRDLANAAGLNIDTIGRLERGVSRAGAPQQQTLQALAAAFGFPTLTAFWHALQGAVPQGPRSATHDMALDERASKLIHAFNELTGPQKDLVEATVLQLRSKLYAQRLGQEAICQVDSTTVHRPRP